MRMVSKTLILAGVFASMLAGSAAIAQSNGLTESDGIVILTEQNKADVVNAANDMPILAAIGAPSFLRSHRAELAKLASAHKKTLLVVFADPNTIANANAIVSSLTNGDANYPMVLYLGERVIKLKGTITQGEITTLVNAELPR